MTTKPPITLVNFFVFNSTLCEKEGEENKKIIYYYPEDVDANTQVKDVGLCEAVVKFIQTFSSSPCESLHTQKTRQVFLQPEEEFWMVMTLGLPPQQKTGDGQIHIDYNDDDIQDHVYQSILLTSYRLFSLMRGTFSNILEKSNNDFDVLKQAIEQFFGKYIPALKVNEADLLDVFEGIHFLPLERFPFLKIQSFINSMEETFVCRYLLTTGLQCVMLYKISILKNIKHVVFLYSSQLVWSGLGQEDMQALYRHLTTRIIPGYVDAELKGEIHAPFCNNTLTSGMQFGRFMTGPKSTDDEQGIQNNIPKIYLENGTIGFHLVIYRALNATVCILIKEDEKLDMEFFRSLDSEIGSDLTSLASELGEQYSKTNSLMTSESQSKYMYMYFNHMNLAEKTTLHSGMTRMGYAVLSQEIMKLLADLNKDLSMLNDNGEIIGKTTSDCWVVGKLSDQREFYFVWQQKNANIVDVNEEMKKLIAAHFQNIFITD